MALQKESELDGPVEFLEQQVEKALFPTSDSKVPEEGTKHDAEVGIREAWSDPEVNAEEKNPKKKRAFWIPFLTGVFIKVMLIVLFILVASKVI